MNFFSFFFSVNGCELNKPWCSDLIIAYIPSHFFFFFFLYIFFNAEVGPKELTLFSLCDNIGQKESTS